MKKILIINTGGTFNKRYNSITGELEIEPTGVALKEISKHWLCSLEIVNIIGKDSLDMTQQDREIIINRIKEATQKHIIIVHGTDTIDQTAKAIDRANLNRYIVLTGAMVPFSINPIESTSNLCSSYGFLENLKKGGVFISMNGIIKDYRRVIKNKEKGYFEESK